jgi:hypothetical protein
VAWSEARPAGRALPTVTVTARGPQQAARPGGAHKVPGSWKAARPHTYMGAKGHTLEAQSRQMRENPALSRSRIFVCRLPGTPRDTGRLLHIHETTHLMTLAASPVIPSALC